MYLTDLRILCNGVLQTAWESGRVSHEQHDALQLRSAEQLIVVHLYAKKNGGPVLFFSLALQTGCSQSVVMHTYT